MDKGGGIYIGNTAGYLSAWILISFLERIQDFYSNPVIRSSCKMISAKLQRSALQVVSQQKTLFFVFYIAGEI
jgi:hypothetical protein